VVLRRLFPSAVTLRTRDRAVLEAVTDTDIVFDVGYVYDPERRLYDHHQPGRPLRADGAPYSSFGLVWLHHGRDYVATLHPDLDTDTLEAVWAGIDARFVTEIDHGDNGYVPPGAPVIDISTSVPRLVEDFVPAWDETSRDTDDCFADAVAVFTGHLERRVSRSASMNRASKAVLAAFEAAEDPRIVVIPDRMPVGSVIRTNGFDEVLYLVECGGSGEWFVNCVRPEGEPFGQRKPLPATWAGLRGSELAALIGVEDAVFCHLQRFTAAARTLSSAYRMAKLAADHDA
jgi:uncharacterized UPF0160 family protein